MQYLYAKLLHLSIMYVKAVYLVVIYHVVLLTSLIYSLNMFLLCNFFFYIYTSKILSYVFKSAIEHINGNVYQILPVNCEV